MSHNTTFESNINDLSIAKRVVEELGGSFIDLGSEQQIRLYGGNTALGVARIEMPGWRYPIAVTKDGNLVYDHFGANSGSMDKFHKFLQRYNQEVLEEGLARQAAEGKISGYYMERGNDGELAYVINY